MAKRNKQIEEISLEMAYTEENTLIKKMDELDNLEQTDREGRTLLAYAAFYGRLDLLKYLVSRGANINAADRNGYTPIHGAVQEQRMDVIQYLLSLGADVNAKDAFGGTPIFIPGPTAPKSLFRLLLDHGADPYLKNDYDISAYDSMAAYPDILAIFDEYKK